MFSFKRRIVIFLSFSLPIFSDGTTGDDDQSIELKNRIARNVGRRFLECTPPPSVLDSVNDARKFQSFPVGSIVKYTCNPGFVLMRGGRTLMCSRGRDTRRLSWIGEPIGCEALTCEAPSTIENGHYDVIGKTVVGSKVKYSCVGGHRLIGEQERVCLVTGAWNGRPPTCQPRTR
ncbi:Uncharacterised protein g10483 [Pycnogonum litorale]